MKRPRIAAIALCVACALAFDPPVRAIASHAGGTAPQQASALTLTGFVIRDDTRAHVPNQRVRLRHIDTGEIVAEATSGTDGGFSFPVTRPGTYAVEALDSGGGVIAVSNPISSTVSPFARDVILILRTPKPAAFFFTGKGLAVLAAAAGAGIAVYTIARNGDDDSVPVSPER